MSIADSLIVHLSVTLWRNRTLGTGYTVHPTSTCMHHHCQTSSVDNGTHIPSSASLWCRSIYITLPHPSIYISRLNGQMLWGGEGGQWPTSVVCRCIVVWFWPWPCREGSTTCVTEWHILISIYGYMNVAVKTHICKMYMYTHSYWPCNVL